MTCEEKEQEFLKLKSSLNREKRKIYYNNQTIEKIVNLTDHLIIFYWFFLFILIARNIVFKREYKNKKKFSITILLIILPFCLDFFKWIINNIGTFFETIKNSFMGIIIPLGEFISNVSSSILSLLSTLANSIVSVIVTIISVIPNMFKAFGKLFANFTPECKATDAAVVEAAMAGGGRGFAINDRVKVGADKKIGTIVDRDDTTHEFTIKYNGNDGQEKVKFSEVTRQVVEVPLSQEFDEIERAMCDAVFDICDKNKDGFLDFEEGKWLAKSQMETT